MKEQNVQTQIKAKLKKVGWLVLKLTVTSYAGFPDLICLRYPGTVAFIEVKLPGKQPTALQSHWISLLTKLGFDTRVARSLDDVRDLLSEPQNKTS